MNWINCKDRLPETIEEVLVYADTTSNPEWPTHYIEFGNLIGSRWFIRNNGDYRDGGHGRDYETGTERWHDYRPPTHWMPLPGKPV